MAGATGHRREHRADAFPPDVGRGRAEGRQHRSQLGDEHACGADRRGDVGREQRAAAAVAEEGLARGGRGRAARGAAADALIMPAMRDLPDAPRDVLSRTVRVRAPSRAQASNAASASSGHVAAEEAVGVDVAEHDERVGDRRVVPAPAVARRTGHGAGRPRTDPEHPAGVDPADRAAAGADRLDVDERQRRPHPISSPRVRRAG